MEVSQWTHIYLRSEERDGEGVGEVARTKTSKTKGETRREKGQGGPQSSLHTTHPVLASTSI